MQVDVHRWDGARKQTQAFGQIVDLSAGGVRIRTNQTNIRPDNQIRVKMELPETRSGLKTVKHINW
jgi:hypothetical protein